MGDSACYREYCPACDLQITTVEETCPECGTVLPNKNSEDCGC